MTLAKSVIFIIIITIVIIGVFPVDAQQARGESGTFHFKTKDQQEVWKVMEKFNYTWTKGNPDEIVNFLHDNIIVISPGRRDRLEGKKACAPAWIDFAKAAVIHDFKVSKPRVVIYNNGNAAVVTYQFEMPYTMKGKHTPLAARDMFFWVKENGKWLITANQFTRLPEEKKEQ
jgi:hypothetical protein